MNISIEFFGIPRQRAGTGDVSVEFDSVKFKDAEITLGQVLDELAERFPDLASECFDGQRLQPSYAANLGGDRFINDPSTVLSDGDCLMIMSADAGG